MNLTNKDIIKVAKLARIGLKQDQQELFLDELSNIIQMVEKLQDLDTTNIKPMTSTINASLVMQADEAQDNQSTRITANAPIIEYDCFVVPKVIE